MKMEHEQVCFYRLKDVLCFANYIMADCRNLSSSSALFSIRPMQQMAKLYEENARLMCRVQQLEEAKSRLSVLLERVRSNLDIIYQQNESLADEMLVLHLLIYEIEQLEQFLHANG